MVAGTMDERKEQGLLRLIAGGHPGMLERIWRRTDLTPALIAALRKHDPPHPMHKQWQPTMNWDGAPDLPERQQACFEQVVSELVERRSMEPHSAEVPEGFRRLSTSTGFMDLPESLLAELPEGLFKPSLSTGDVDFPGLILLAERGSSADLRWLLDDRLVCPGPAFPIGWPFPWTLEPTGNEALRRVMQRVPAEYRQVALFDLLAQGLEANPALDEIPSSDLRMLAHWWVALPGVTERQWAALTARPTLRKAVACVREVKINEELHHRLYRWATERDEQPLMLSLLGSRSALSDEAYLDLAGRVSVEDRAAAILWGGMTPRVIDELMEDPDLTRELLDPRGEGAVLSIAGVHGFSNRFSDRLRERFGLKVSMAVV